MIYFKLKHLMMYVNRSGLYRDLEQKFGLEPGIIPEDDIPNVGEDEVKEVATDPDMDSTEYVLGKNWRDLIPVIKVDISTGKFIFGNRLLPTTLLITMEEAHFTYSTKPATCNLDHFMHFVKTKAENLTAFKDYMMEVLKTKNQETK